MYKNLHFKNNQSEITPPLNKGGFEVEERGFLFSNPMYSFNGLSLIYIGKLMQIAIF